MTGIGLNPAPSTLDTAGFITEYATETIRCLDAILPNLLRVLPRLVEAIRGDQGERGTIYVLGNGGSSAIARILALTATNLIASQTGTARWVGAWDSHQLTAESTIHGFDDAAARLLQRDQADRRDLVILISGSGNSRNLLAIARHCTEHGIPLLTLTGRTGGALAPYDPHGLRVDSTDQQIIEDVALAAGLTLLNLLAADVNRDPASEILARSRPNLVQALTINQPWLQALADATITATTHGGRIVVLAPEGGALALSAEHTAHNLRWDLRHDNQHARLHVVDGISLCDDTGMSNDTGTAGTAASRLLDGANHEDLVLLFADAPGQPAVGPTRAAACVKDGPALFGCYRTTIDAGPRETTWTTGVHGPLGALTAQTVGHLLLRSVRAATRPANSLDLRDPVAAWQSVAPQHARPIR